MTRKVIFFAIAVMFGMCSVAVFGQENTLVKSQWDVRGIKAIKTLKPILDKNREPTGIDKYKCLLEMAYATHLEGMDARDIVVKVEDGFEIRKLMMSAGEQGLLSIAFIYQNGKLMGSRIESLPAAWQVAFMPDHPQYYLIQVRETTGGQGTGNEGVLCQIVINPNNPFDTAVGE